MGKFDSDVGAQAQQLLGDLRGGIDRIEHAIRELRTFAQPQEDRPAALDVRDLLDLALKLASNEIRHRARVVRAYKSVPKVLASEQRLSQVFLNLVLNAAQAIPAGAVEGQRDLRRDSPQPDRRRHRRDFRHGVRHSGALAGEGFRALGHDEDRRRGHRLGPLHLSEGRQGAGRPDPAPKQTGPRDDLHRHATADGRRRPGASPAQGQSPLQPTAAPFIARGR